MDSLKPAVVAVSASGLVTAQSCAAELGAELFLRKGRIQEGLDAVYFDETLAQLRALFAEGRPIVAVCAAGIIVRALAPLLEDKRQEPPVLAVAEDGSAVVPLLGGHRGANAMARSLAQQLNGQAAVTTAGDLAFGLALDEPPTGYRLGNPGQAKEVMAALLSGAKVKLKGSAPWLLQSDLPFDETADLSIEVSTDLIANEGSGLHYHPQSLALGVGCARNCPPEEVIDLAEASLRQAGLAWQAVAVVVSIDVKADEEAVHALADHLGVPARFFPADRLEEERARLANPSEVVFQEVGCHGVSEGAALAATGADGKLLLAKQKTANATCAIAGSPEPLDLTSLGRSRGHLSVVGIGPGSSDWRTPEASRLVAQASDLVGYGLYLDILGPAAEGKVRHEFALGEEEKRVRFAMELAAEGKDVALISSGDAGIYAMGSLVFELLDRPSDQGGVSAACHRMAVTCAPGISALQAAAARTGAPLGHDFCTISLSDLLTPWETIEQRLKAAAEGDFVIAFYNPVSLRRRRQLQAAKEILLNHRPADTPVLLASNLGRPQEKLRYRRLADLEVDEVDMLTLVMVGSSQSRLVAKGDGGHWFYTPRGYAKKAAADKAEREKVA